MPSCSASSTSKSWAGISSRDFERDHGDVAGAGTRGGAGDVDRFGHRRALVRETRRRLLEVRIRRTAYSDARQGGAGGIHGDVAAADHDDPLADVDREASVHVDQELDRLEHAVGVGTLDVESAAERGADAEEHGVVAVQQLVEGDVDARAGSRICTSTPRATIASMSAASTPRSRRYSGMPSHIAPPSLSVASYTVTW